MALFPIWGIRLGKLMQISLANLCYDIHMEVNVHEAKSNLSKLIVRAEAGEEVIIARAGRPAVRLVPVHALKHKLYSPGALKGRLTVPDDFLEPDADLEKLFYETPLMGDAAASRRRMRRPKS
jgi:prevent-host-death family protein